MTRKEVRRAVEQRMELGYTQQHAFEELRLQGTGLSDRKLADVVRYVPSSITRDRFRIPHMALLIAIGLYGLLQIAPAFMELDLERTSAWRFARFLPIATVLLGYSVYRYRGEGLVWLGLLNFWASLGIFKEIQHMAMGTLDPLTAAKRVLTISICCLAWYLHSRMFPKYVEEKDPTRQGPSHFVFRSEPGMRMM